MCYEWLRAVCFGDLLFLAESNVSQIESKVNGGLSTSLVEPVIQVDTKWCEILHMVDFLTYEVHHRMLCLFIPSTPQNYLKIHMSYSLCRTCGYPRSVSICKYGPFLWCVNSLKCGVVAIYCLRVWIGENADFFFWLFSYHFICPFAKAHKPVKSSAWSTNGNHQLRNTDLGPHGCGITHPKQLLTRRGRCDYINDSGESKYIYYANGVTTQMRARTT